MKCTLVMPPSSRPEMTNIKQENHDITQDCNAISYSFCADPELRVDLYPAGAQ